VGNKCDLPRKVEYDTAAKFAKENNCNYMEVSAYSGHNIQAAFKMMVEEVHRKVKGQPTDNSRSVLRPPADLKPSNKGCKC